MSEAGFEEPEQYEAMLDRGIGLSGEDKHYFLAGRIRDLQARLPREFSPRRVLDYGCGTGETVAYLSECFPTAKVIGADVSRQTVEYARDAHPGSRVSFVVTSDLASCGGFDLCYCNGVFHHVDPDQRVEALESIHRFLRPRGRFAFFENNPWNPGTRLVMSRIPFDRDAQTISPPAGRRLLGRAGFSQIEEARFLFYFPKILSWLRKLEPVLVRLPLGAQYWILGTKAAR